MPFINLHKVGVFINIKKLEEIYLEGKDVDKITKTMMVLYKLDIEKDIESNFQQAQKINSFYKNEEDSIFYLYQNPPKIKFTDILSKEVESNDLLKNYLENYSINVEILLKSDAKEVIEKILNGVALQGVLKDEILKLIVQYFTENIFPEVTIDKTIENEKDLEIYLDDAIYKQKYAFTISKISVQILRNESEYF